MTPLCLYVIAYLLSCAGGWLVAGLSVWLMRKSIGTEYQLFKWIDVWVGVTERAVCDYLVYLDA